MSSGYYDSHLSAERLKHVYEIASPRIRQYLEAEIAHVLSFLQSNDEVLELGCGYGRVIKPLAERVGFVVGIDTSMASLQMARQYCQSMNNVSLCKMDAGRLGFIEGSFDVVVCIQNGISAFKVDPRTLIKEAVRVTRPDGQALFSTYLPEFWPHRLEWFEAQSAEGLLGEIDYDQTGNGVIVCKDGFRATTPRRGDLLRLTRGLPGTVRLVEVDRSSLFCEIHRTVS